VKVAVVLKLLVVFSDILLTEAERAFAWESQFTPGVGKRNYAVIERYCTLKNKRFLPPPFVPDIAMSL